MYYVKIFGLFLDHTPGQYARYYRVGSYFPPYAVYYYMLLALGHVVSLPMADKLVVCTNIVLTAYGLRYLAMRVGRGGDVAAFLVLPLLLDWPLVMGFVNYTLSCAFGLVAAGVWARFDDDHSRLRQLAYVLLLYLMTLTHPIPLAFLLLGCGIDLMIRAGRKYWSEYPQPWSAIIARAVCLAASLPAILYIRRFTVKNMLNQPHSTWGLSYVRHTAAMFLRGTGLFPYTINTIWGMLYRAGMFLTLIAAFVLAAMYARQRWKARQLDAATLWFFVSVGALLVLPTLPRDLNGSHFLAERLSSVIVYCLIVSGAGVLAQKRGAAGVLVLSSVLLSVVALSLGTVRLRAAANAIVPLTQKAPVTPGQIGVLIQAGHYKKRDLTFEPFLWAGVHYFRVNDLIVYNTAWLDGPQIPLKLVNQNEVLESTTEQRLPNWEIPRYKFQKGNLWNPDVASFFLVEKITPPLKAETHPKTWQEWDPLVPNLNLRTCQLQQWYCIAQRQ